MADALRERGFEPELISIEQITPQIVTEKIQQAEILGLGYPIHGSNAPPIMQNFIEALPSVESPKAILIYVTQLAWSGNGASFLRPRIKKKGYHVHWAIEFDMPNNLSIDFGRFLNEFFKRFSPDLQKVIQKAALLAQRMASGQAWIEGKIPFFNMGWIQRIPYRLTLPYIQKNTWRVDSDKCSHCGRCESICPMGNITLIKGLPHFADRCTFCVRCFNFCPELAILAYHKPFDPKIFGPKPYQGPVPEFEPEQLIASGS